MIFALGFLSAGMLTLLFLPVFWRRAMRLSARRLEMQMPLSMTEIVAERDQLRAEFAAERRKLEQKSEKLAAQVASTRVDLGKRSVQIVGLEQALANLKQDEQEARALNAKFELQFNEMELERAVVEKAHYDAAGMLGRRNEALAQLTREHQDNVQLSNAQRAAIAGLETQIAGLEMQLDSSRQALLVTRKELDEKISLGQFLERERDQFRADAVAARARHETLRDTMGAQQQLVEKLDGELRAGRRERARLSESIAQLTDKAAEATRVESRLRLDIQTQLRGLEKSKQALADRSEAQKSAQAVLQGALDAARRDNQALRSQIVALRMGNAAGRSAVASTPVEGGAVGWQTAVPMAEEPVKVAEMADLAMVRSAIADLGSDIIRAASVLDKAAGQNGSSGRVSTSASASDLPAKFSELHDRLLAVTARH